MLQRVAFGERRTPGRWRGSCNPAVIMSLSSIMVRGWCAAAVVAGVLLAGAAFAQGGVGSQAPEITLQDLSSGRAVRLADLRGRVVLVNIWGTWCRPCVREMPYLDGMYQRYRRQGLVVIGVAQDTNRNAVESFLEERRVRYPIVHDGEHIVARRYERVARGSAMPRSFLVDRRGRVQYIHVSSREGDLPALDQQVQRLLRESPDR